MRATRTYHRRDNWPSLLPTDAEDADVTSFGNSPVRFSVEGQPAADDFLLQHGTWHELGEPDRIRVSVEAAERSAVPPPSPKPTLPGYEGHGIGWRRKRRSA